MGFEFDRQKIILGFLKWMSYLINIIIVAGILFVIAFYVYTLFMSGTERVKRIPRHEDAPRQTKPAH